MKKRILSFILVLMLIVQSMPIETMAYPVPELGAQNSVEKFESNTPMSVAHRSAWRNGPENSLIAIAASIRMGIDVAELDVKLTKDGVIVLSHDGTIDRCTMATGNVSDYTWENLKSIAVKPGQGGSSAYTLTDADAQLLNSLPHYAEHCGAAAAGKTMPLTRLDDTIELLKQLGPNTMINLDHCFSESLFVSSYVLFRETNMLNNVFFKNSVNTDTMNSWYVAAATAWNQKYPTKTITANEVQNSIKYVYIINNEDYSILQSHLDNGDNLVMTEICIANDDTDAKIQAKLEPWCKQKGIAMFINTMWSGLCSTKADTETTWAEMLDRGYVAIQTDHPSELAKYMSDYNKQRKSTDTIEAEHFHMFNYNNYGLKIAESADYNLNKKIEGMGSGDYLEYRNILFDGTETQINFKMKGFSNGALSVYIDGMESENIVTQAIFSRTSDDENITAVIENHISEGTHTVYLQVNGASQTDLLSLDNFCFLGSNNFTENITLSETHIVTQTGVPPVLPDSVKVSDNGINYYLAVRWEQIPKENYTQENSFVVLGYLPALGRYTKASVEVKNDHTITPEITTDNLALWLDASEGVTAEQNSVSAWKSRVGNITATIKSGSPTLTDNTASGKKGIYFDGNDDALNLVLPDNFWNEKNDFTVLMYTASENKTSSLTNNTNSQYHSIMYFGETSSWGSAYFNASQNEIIWRFGSGSSGDYGTTCLRDISTGNMYTNTAIRKNGYKDTLFVDGEKIFTDTTISNVTKNIKSDGWIGVGKNNTFFKGTVCEILIYDAALTDEQIAAAQLALAEKYAAKATSTENVTVNCEAGIKPELPETVDVTYNSGNVVKIGVSWEDINPNYYLNEGTFTVKGTLANGDSINATITVTAVNKEKVTETGLVFWLNSSNGITTDSSGKITKWQSKVGDYYATNKKGNASLKQNAVNGKSAVVFDGDEDVLQMTLENNRLNNLNGVTVVVYAAPKTGWNNFQNQSFDWNVQRHTLFYVDEVGEWGSFYTGIYSDAISARFGTGTSNDYGFRGKRTETNTGYTTTAIRWDGNNMSYDVDLNGADFDTGSSKGAVTKNNNNILYLGTGKDNSYWSGSLCEIMLYDRILSDSELQDIYKYLNNTYENDVTGIYLKETGQQFTQKQGDTIELTAATIPANANNTNLIYTSSNTNVATVNKNGKITATGHGYSTITVTTEDGNFQSQCTILVIPTDEEMIWNNIQNMVTWANAQEMDSYSNWTNMQQALNKINNLSKNSSKEELATAYNTLRTAMLSLQKKPNIIISNDIKVEGYQINASTGGSGVIGSVEPFINGKNVSKWGFVYALVKNGTTTYDIADQDMYVGADNKYVAYLESTSEGTVNKVFGTSKTATYFIRTTLFGASTPAEFSAKYKVRAYALLEDNTYVYSNIHSYSVYDVCDYLYQNRKMTSLLRHEYLYSDILKVVKPDYEEVAYNWANEMMKPE